MPPDAYQYSGCPSVADPALAPQHADQLRPAVQLSAPFVAGRAAPAHAASAAAASGAPAAAAALARERGLESDNQALQRRVDLLDREVRRLRDALEGSGQERLALQQSQMRLFRKAKYFEGEAKKQGVQLQATQAELQASVAAARQQRAKWEAQHADDVRHQEVTVKCCCSIVELLAGKWQAAHPDGGTAALAALGIAPSSSQAVDPIMGDLQLPLLEELLTSPSRSRPPATAEPRQDTPSR